LVGPGRTKSIALRSALGGGIASIGPLVAGFLLQYFYWGSVFLITLPLAVVAVVMAWLFVPANVNESTEPVDNIGGVLSLVLVGSLILSINFAPVPNKGALTLVLAVLAAAALIGFYLPPAPRPQPALRARRRCAADLLGGCLRGNHCLRLADGAAFVSQQYLQNVLGYSTLEAGAAFLPAVVAIRPPGRPSTAAFLPNGDSAADEPQYTGTDQPPGIGASVRASTDSNLAPPEAGTIAIAWGPGCAATPEEAEKLVTPAHKSNAENPRKDIPDIRACDPTTPAFGVQHASPGSACFA